MNQKIVIGIVVVLALAAIAWLVFSSQASAQGAGAASLLAPKGSTPATKEAAASAAQDGGPTGAATRAVVDHATATAG